MKVLLRKDSSLDEANEADDAVLLSVLRDIDRGGFGSGHDLPAAPPPPPPPSASARSRVAIQ